jgi:polar amino acid transport system substrate-binding protein
MIRKLFLFILLPFLLAFASCSKIIPNKKIKIGLDPTFFSSPVGNKGALVYAFTIDLLSEVFKNTNFDVFYQELNFDNTIDSLKENQSDLIISPLAIRYETLQLYHFSNSFLSFADIFISRKEEKEDFSFYKGKIIAIPENPEILSLFANYPEITLAYYSFIPSVLEMIANYTVDGAIVPSILLSSHLSSEYRRLLNIGSKNLTDRGLRLLLLKNKNKGVINIFNKRLAHLIEDGTYQKLLNKWTLSL